MNCCKLRGDERIHVRWLRRIKENKRRRNGGEKKGEEKGKKGRGHVERKNRATS